MEGKRKGRNKLCWMSIMIRLCAKIAQEWVIPVKVPQKVPIP